MTRVSSLRSGLLVVALFGSTLCGGLSAGPLWAQDPPPERGVNSKDPGKKKRREGRDGIRMDAPPAAAPKPKAGSDDARPKKSEPQLLVAALAKWPSVDAKRAAVRLAAQPSVSFGLCKEAMLRPKQDWRMIAGLAAAFGHMRKLEALELLEAKLQDRTMFLHSHELLDAILRIDPVGGRTRLLGSLLHPASAVVVEAGKRLEDRVTEADLPTLRDIYEAGGATSRAAAVNLMARADAVAARADLVRALRDKTPEVCISAATALGRDDSPESLALLQKAARAPIDRQLAYAYLAIGMRAERTTENLLRKGDLLVLTGSRGLKSQNPLNRSVAAIVLADAGYLHEMKGLDKVYDESLVPVLLDAWVGQGFWNDMSVIQPLALRRLARLTGQTELRRPREWVSWWTENREEFSARRVLVKIEPEQVSSLIVTLRGKSAPGAEITVLAVDADLLPPPLTGEMVLLLPARDAARLMTMVNESGLLASKNGLSVDLDGIGPLGINVVAGKRQRYIALRPEFLPEPIQALIDHVAALRSRFVWQRYRPLGSSVDLATFVRTMAPRFEEGSDPTEQRALLAALMARSVVGVNEGRDISALGDLLADADLPPLLASEDVNRLLGLLGKQPTINALGEAIIRVLAASKNESAAPLLLDFLQTRPSRSTHALLTLVLAQANDGVRFEATKSEESNIRIAALAALRLDNDQGANISLARAALNDATPTVRAEAVRALGRLRAEDAREELEMLASKSGELRVAAIEALGFLGGKQSLSALMSAYASNNAAVRLAAVKAMAESREPEGLSAVVFAMSGDPSSLVREVATRSIRAIGSDQAAQALRKLAIDPGQPEQPRATALKSFAQLRGEKAASDLKRLLFDPSELVADQAALSMAEWRSADPVPRLIEMLENGRSVSRAREALESVSLEAFEQQDPKLLGALYSGWFEVAKDVGPRGWFVDALLRRGATSELLPRYAKGEVDREMVPILLETLKSDEWYLRRAADLALRSALGRSVGIQEPWTPPGERTRMKRAWSAIWGEILGR